MKSLRQLLTEQKAIRFVDYMQQVLYAPNEGYYSSTRPKFGQQGDFITAPELSPLFGRALAMQCEQVLLSIPASDVLEFGAGSGRLCIDVLQQLEKQQCLPKTYWILELSAGLRALQQANISQAIPHLVDKVQWLERWPEDFKGVVLANEVLDAMPVHRFLQHEKGLLESWITMDNQGVLHESWRDEVDADLHAWVTEHLSHLPIPYQSEVNLLLRPWIQQLAACLTQGVILLIDYGFPRAEYYHEDRRLGTLMCHRQHQSHPDPLQYPGEQDITAHVDFTLVAEAAMESGLHVAGFSNQASFLLSCGLLSLMENDLSLSQDLTQKQAIKQLTLPHEMGELFKVMALSKQVDLDLQGFILSDKRASL